jgi:flagellar biosynthesis/type III secretory pathway M-ring protein FliF/YscJ
MDQLRQVLANIQQQVGKMTASQKLLLASLTVIAVMTLFLVSQYAAKPSMVNLMAAGTEVDTVRALQGAGFTADVVDGQIVLPEGQQRSALAYLAETGQLPGDTTLLFSNLIGSQDWKASSQQHRQQYNIALQNELAANIAHFRGVQKASVILDVPQITGLGRAARAATGSVTIFTSGAGGLSQDMVDAAARLVSGAVSGLDAEDVQVIDGSTGRARTSSGDESRSSGRYLEYATQVEKHTREKIQGLFGHIPNVVVSVTAHVDITSVQSTENLYAPKDEGSVAMLQSERKSNLSAEQASRSAEPGVRSNQAVSINQGGGSGNSTTEDMGDTTFATAIGSRTKTVLDPRGMPTHLSASIIIPQEYIADIIRKSRVVAEGEEPQPVTNDEIVDYFGQFKPTIESLIRPHLLSLGADGTRMQGELTVDMAPIGGAVFSAGVGSSVGLLGSLTGGGGGALAGGGQLVETVLVGVLAVIALGMMAMMVKRSGKRIELPDAEQLVGIPPNLESNGDLIGEAGEGEHVMTGIEVDDQLVEVQHLRTQVTELIDSDPESAAALVERWAEQTNQ